MAKKIFLSFLIISFYLLFFGTGNLEAAYQNGNGITCSSLGEECLSLRCCDAVNTDCVNGKCVAKSNGGGISIGGGLINPLTCGSLDECVNGVVDFIFRIAMVLTPFMIIIAGFLFITAVGNPEKITQAKKIMLWAIIGFLVVSLSKGIMFLITDVLGG